jgi:ketosteroid isomerase-like protein
VTTSLSRAIGLVFLFLAATSTCLAQTSSGNGSRANSADERAVEARTTAFLEAVRRQDTVALYRFQAPEFTWVLAPDQVLNLAQARAVQARSFSAVRGFSEFQYSMGPVRVVGDTAVAVVLLRAVTTLRGPADSSYVMGQTASHEDTWIRHGGEWLLARDRVLEMGLSRDGRPQYPPDEPSPKH